MTMVASSSKRIVTDTWVEATWDDFLETAYDDPAYVEGRAYFDAGEMRIEMASLGVGHSRQNGVVWNVITLFIAAKGIDITNYMNASFQKAGEREFQPMRLFILEKVPSTCLRKIIRL